jgi:SAM-dependent methyltransferase
MLSVASDKCAGLPVQFVCQDMSRLALPEPVDAVVCCLDSVNYVTRPKLLQRAFQKVCRYLKPHGLFLFDAKTPLALEGADEQIYLDETEELYCVWRGDYDPKRRVCGYGIDLFRLRPDGAWDRGSEYHEEYAYTPQELEDYLKQAGFACVKRYGNLKKRPPRDGEERVFFAARKGT